MKDYKNCKDIHLLKNEILEKVTMLELKTYNHSDNAQVITNQIMDIIKATASENITIKENVANEAILLLENFRFE